MFKKESGIRKAFLDGEYSFTLNKVHTCEDSGIKVHDTLSVDENKELYNFVLKAIKSYKATKEEKETELEKELLRSFTKGYDKGYTEGYDKGSKDAMRDTIKAFAHMHGDYGEGKTGEK